jgi:FAD/FMN-containing dehydrogenase
MQIGMKNMTRDMSKSITQLRAVLNGRVIGPGDAGYEEARTVFSGGIDRRPAIIIRPADASEVSRVVTLARESGMELAVRSGGHSLAGHSVSDGGIVLDLADMRALHIDAERRTAWAQTGLTAGQYTSEAGAYGLATGFGDTGSEGSPWAAASATSFASMASPSTTCWPLRS